MRVRKKYEKQHYASALLLILRISASSAFSAFVSSRSCARCPVDPQLKLSPKGKAKHMPASVTSSVPSVAEGLTQVEAEQINQYLTAEQARAEPAAAQDANVQPSPQDFIPAPDGGLDYGEITPEMGKAMRRQAGKIRLRRGDETQGFVHIAERHLDQFKKRGFESVPDFVASVAKSFTAIYKRDGAALDVVLEDGSRGRLVVQLEMAADGDFYDVKTASPIREDQCKNREPLWERAGTSTPTAGESSPPSPWGQNGADSVPPTATEAQPITRADVTAAQQQAATLIGERIDAMTAGEVNTIARRFLPTMGVKPTVSKERNKAAVTDFTKVNPMAAADEFGVTLPADVRRALDAEMQGKVSDAGQDDGVNPRVPRENLAPAKAQEQGVKKEPWQMTALEFSQQENGNPHWNQSYAGKDDGAYLADAAATHRRLVQDAVAAGKLDDPNENIRRGNEAMDRVISGQKDEPNAMTRPDHGPVSFVWGKVGNAAKGVAGGNGIAKIIAKRTAEGSDGDAVARKMVEVIALGTASPVYGPKGGERFNVSYDGHTAVLSLHRFGNEETWLLTGWDDVESDGATAGNADGAYAPESSGMRSQEGADDGSVAPAPPAAQPQHQRAW